MAENSGFARLTIRSQNIETTARATGFLGRGVRRRSPPQNPAHPKSKSTLTICQHAALVIVDMAMTDQKGAKAVYRQLDRLDF
jgi:hypothetical protein